MKKARDIDRILFGIWLAVFLLVSAVLCIKRPSIAGLNAVRMLTLYAFFMLDLLFLMFVFCVKVRLIPPDGQDKYGLAALTLNPGRALGVCALLTLVYILYCAFGHRFLHGITLMQDSIWAGFLMCILVTVQPARK